MKRPRRQLEREFGVPIAGEILEPSLWTQTALKRLPVEGPLSWEGLFGRQAPVVLDIGCGNGRFLIGSALWRPALDHIGIDVLPVVLRYATRRANQRGLTNVRFAARDGLSFLHQYVPPSSLREIHCYHPQPYHEPEQKARRLITPAFLRLVVRALDAEGSLFLQTDNAAYWQYMLEVVPRFFDWHEQPGPWPDAPKGRTRREIIALRRGLAVFRGWGQPRRDMGDAELDRLATTLPPPLFDAGPRRRDIEDLENQLG